MISNKEILDKIVSLEKTKVHSSFLIDDLDFWPAVRIRLAFGLIEKRYQDYTNKSNLIKKNLAILFKLFYISRTKKKKIDILFVSHSNYQYVIEGKTYDRVLEGYKNNCRKKRKDYSELNLASGDIVSFNDNSVIKRTQAHILLLKVYAYILSIVTKNRKSYLDSPISYITESLNETFSDCNASAFKLKQYIIYINLLIRYYKYSLKNLGVKEIYQATYYDPIGLSINAAASQLGITTYCAQHGGQSKNNPAFGRWTDVPLKGYEMLPDVFLCWDEGSAHTINAWSSNNKKHTASIAGYQWPELWKSGKIQYSGTEKLLQCSKGKLNILYSMQPSIGGPPLVIKNIVEHFSDRVNWWFRLHPRQIGSQVEQDVQKMYGDLDNVFILEATNEPLPAIMNVVDIHLTCFSSCVYEAMIFGVPTIFIDKAGKEYFDDIIQSGKAKLSLTFEELVRDLNDEF
ncbi:hypothetical protein OAO13_03490 [Candidatus Pseudothioglobus singularis]|nr:hypothetical protein [Candidatus Pseudothioglobus singularis]